jgi:hypothetical protein
MMALQRIWTPSGNYSGGSTKRLIVLHSTEGFTGPNGAYDCAKYFQTDCGASAQVCIDNNRGKVWEGVSRPNGSWTQCQYNSVSVSAEQCGYASWSRDYWLTNRSNELHNAADWIAEESRALGIPIVLLSDSQAQSGGRGVCYHSHLGGSGCGHSDPGAGYPIDQVIEWAKGGGSTPAPETTGVNMPSCVIVNNVLHEVGVWTDGRPHYQCEDADVPWYQIDMDSPPFKVKGDVSICANYNTGLLVVSGTGLDGNLYTWQQRPDLEVSAAALRGKWGRYKRYAHNSLR